MAMNEGKFELRGWTFSGDGEKDFAVGVLGLIWKTNEDVLKLNSELVNSVNTDVAITKRLILSMAQRVFDPIGFTCPATLVPKLLLQELWKSRLPWDYPIDEEKAKVFREWIKQLLLLLNIEIPRWISLISKREQRVSLHVFCDASKNAFAAVVFLRVADGDSVVLH